MNPWWNRYVGHRTMDDAGGEGGEGGGGGGGGDTTTPEAARTFLKDFVPDALEGMDDTAALAEHKRFTQAIDKVRPPGGDTKNWRENYVKARGGDDKLLERLQRFASPEAAFDALISTTNRIREVGLRQPFPADAADDVKAAWRAENGVPASPKDYNLDKLPGNVVIGEDMGPVVEKFLPVAHEMNLNQAQTQALVAWEIQRDEQNQAERAAKDKEVKERVINELRAEWGDDYMENQNRFSAALELLPNQAKSRLWSARLGDGTPLLSDPDFLRGMVALHRAYDPHSTLTGAGEGGTIQSIDDEIKQIKGWMGAPNGTADYKKYWGDPKLQERYTGLLDTKERLEIRSKSR